MSKPNYLSHDNVTQSILGFAAYARANELNVGIREAQEAMVVASLGLIADKECFRYALKSVFCSCEENAHVFDKLFSDYWGMPKASIRTNVPLKQQPRLKKPKQRSLVMMVKGNESDAKEEEGKNTAGANAIEQLRKTDFSRLSDLDSSYLEKLAMRLWRQMSRRLKKKLMNSTKRGQIDIRQTIRNNISNGGTMLELKLRQKKPNKNRLVILLDVSGSMDKSSFFLLRFVLALRSHFQALEDFICSAKCLRIT